MSSKRVSGTIAPLEETVTPHQEDQQLTDKHSSTAGAASGEEE